MVKNLDIFLDLFNKIKEGATQEEICKDFGGSSIYIPSYKKTKRDADIRKQYQSLMERKFSKKQTMLHLQRQYNLSEQHLYKIIKQG